MLKKILSVLAVVSFLFSFSGIAFASIATSTSETANSIPFWTSTEGSPATLGSDTNLSWTNLGTPGYLSIIGSLGIGIGSSVPSSTLTIASSTDLLMGNSVVDISDNDSGDGGSLLSLHTDNSGTDCGGDCEVTALNIYSTQNSLGNINQGDLLDINGNNSEVGMDLYVVGGSTGGLPAFKVNGIGRTSKTAEIQGAPTASRTLQIDSGGTGGVTDTFENLGKFGIGVFPSTAASSPFFSIRTATSTVPIMDWGQSSALGQIAANGNVGIGTSTANTLLSVGNTQGINFTTGTTTANTTGGYDLEGGGCFAVKGVCVGLPQATYTTGQSIVTNTGAGPTASFSVGGAVTATCSGSQIVSGGGGNDNLGSGGINQYASYPSASNAWSVQYSTAVGGVGANTITAYAICVNP